MVSAISNAGPDYIGPGRQVVQDRLLDERYAIAKRAGEERVFKHSERRRKDSYISCLHNSQEALDELLVYCKISE